MIQIVQIKIIDGFKGIDGDSHVIMQWGDEDKYIITSSLCGTGSHTFMTWKEVEEEREKLMNGDDAKSEDAIFEQEFTSEDIAYMPADEDSKGYYYNTITGKIIEQT